nr:isovaleryl-CoA dehydrogenase [Acetobacteraceae bacterium]
MIPNRLTALEFDHGEEIAMLRESVRSFSADRIAPLAAEIDR